MILPLHETETNRIELYDIISPAPLAALIISELRNLQTDSRTNYENGQLLLVVRFSFAMG